MQKKKKKKDVTQKETGQEGSLKDTCHQQSPNGNSTQVGVTGGKLRQAPGVRKVGTRQKQTARAGLVVCPCPRGRPDLQVSCPPGRGRPSEEPEALAAAPRLLSGRPCLWAPQGRRMCLVKTKDRPAETPETPLRSAAPRPDRARGTHRPAQPSSRDPDVAHVCGNP